jgi:hypothetical protein
MLLGTFATSSKILRSAACELAAMTPRPRIASVDVTSSVTSLTSELNLGSTVDQCMAPPEVEVDGTTQRGIKLQRCVGGAIGWVPYSAAMARTAVPQPYEESHTLEQFSLDEQFEQLKKGQLLRRAWAFFFRLECNRTTEPNQIDSRESYVNINSTSSCVYSCRLC